MCVKVLSLHVSMKKQILYTVLFLLSVHGLIAQQLDGSSLMGLRVYDIQQQTVVFEQNAGLSLVPASTQKLITAATALETFGPDYRFETRLYKVGEVRDGILYGDLWIVAGGDPSLGSRHFAQERTAFLRDWVASVLDAGIRQVNGGIRVDVSRFDDQVVSPYWIWEDLGNYYAAGVSALSVFDNSMELTLSSGIVGSEVRIDRVWPPHHGASFDNRLVAKSHQRDSAYLYGIPFSGQRLLRGSIPAHRSTFVVKGDLPDPTQTLILNFRDALHRAGVQTKAWMLPEAGKRIDRFEMQAGAQWLHTTSSPPLRELLRILLWNSDNVYAETILRQLAYYAGSYPATSKDGLDYMRRFWQSRGLDLSGCFWVDGSGLSPLNRMTARGLSEILVYMQSKAVDTNALRLLLPVAGKEGTVRQLLKNEQADVVYRLKSGSMNGVLCYAGYREKEGRIQALVVLANDVETASAELKKVMENVLRSH